jgi:hypothetical protein
LTIVYYSNFGTSAAQESVIILKSQPITQWPKNRVSPTLKGNLSLPYPSLLHDALILITANPVKTAIEETPGKR